MKNKPTEMYDKFGADECDNTFDVLSMLKVHMCHNKMEYQDGIRIVTDKKMYNVQRKLARKLLYILKHKLPSSEEECEQVYNISKVLDNVGAKGLYKQMPIIINTSSREVVDGSKRLLALALGELNGTFFEIELVDQV